MESEHSSTGQAQQVTHSLTHTHTHSLTRETHSYEDSSASETHTAAARSIDERGSPGAQKKQAGWLKLGESTRVSAQVAETA